MIDVYGRQIVGAVERTEQSGPRQLVLPDEVIALNEQAVLVGRLVS